MLEANDKISLPVVQQSSAASNQILATIWQQVSGKKKAPRHFCAKCLIHNQNLVGRAGVEPTTNGLKDAKSIASREVTDGQKSS